MNKTFTAFVLGAAILAASNASIAAETGTEVTVAPAVQAAAAPAGQVASMFDSSTWHDAAGDVPNGHIEAFNPADPESWMKFVDPKTHSKLHTTFTNPAGYAQFLNPGMYMQMMNPAVWMKWMNPNSYKVAMSGETMAYWMQPGAYMHVAKVDRFMQMTQPENYTKLMDTASKTMNNAAGQASGFNFFDPTAWAKTFSQSATPAAADSTQDQG